MSRLPTDLNPEQLQAVTHTKGPLLVLAGAGSGKTRIVAARIAHLIAQGTAPENILAVTFTNKAAQEMHERIEKIVSSHTRPLIATFHSLSARILRESIHHLGYQSNFAIYDEDDSNKLLKGCLEKLGVKADEAKGLKALISHVKNQLLSPSEIDLSDAPVLHKSLFIELYNLYQMRLKEANALDFDDLLFLTVQLFQEHSSVAEHYQNRWHYLLIDEYQDTNKTQYMLARFIVAKSHNIFVVGDPDQSIYSWRGANINNILNFEKDYPGASIVRLEQNYRSRKVILDAANALITLNRNRFEKRLWSTKTGGEKITLFVGDSERDEAFFVASEIERLHSEEQIPLNEVAIFYRTNFQSRTFEDILLHKKIPYTIIGGISFYQRKEVKDILCFLHMVQSDHDFIAFTRTLNIPKRGLGEATVEKLRAEASLRGIGLFELLKDAHGIKLTEKQRRALDEYVALIESLRALAIEAPLQTLIIETIRQSDYLEYLQIEEKETFEDRKANLHELISKAAEWESLNDGSGLSQFLEELSLASAIDRTPPKEKNVNLMTLHNGKGLEFTVVFLVGMEEDLFPHANSRNKNDAIEEERRLCYVGMTRAKERLYLTAGQTRFLWGTSRVMRPSRFLREIPRECFERAHGIKTGARS